MKKKKNIKTIPYTFLGEKYNLSIVLATYNYGGNLYVGMVDETGEDYCNISINIPNELYMSDTKNGKYEISINNDTSKELIKKLTDMGILENTDMTMFSGYSMYNVKIFNENKAKDYIIKDYRKKEKEV